VEGPHTFIIHHSYFIIYPTMATFEEKILAYLDGSLPAKDREEVLAGMSGGDATAAQHRAVFNEHLRMADMMTLVQKPISAPLALQRDLASKIPVLAVKLPYLAAEQKRRGILAEWLGQIPASSINSLLFIALAIIGGCVWFAVKDRGATPLASNSSNANVQSNASAQSAGMSDGTSQYSPQNVLQSNSNGLDASASSINSNRVEVSYPHHNAANASNSSRGTTNVRQAVKDWIAVQKKLRHPAEPVALDNQMQNETSVPEQVEQVTPPEKSLIVPEQELLSAKIPNSSPAVMTGSGPIIHSLSTLNEREENTDPIRFFAAEEYRFLGVNPQAPLSDYTRSNGIQSNNLSTNGHEFGIDYAINPWIAFGLRGGDARFVQEQSVTTPSSKTSGYSYLGRNVKETMLVDPFSLWLGPAITYSLSASQALLFAATLAMADAFTGSFSPIVRGEISALLNLSDAVALRAAFSYEADRMPAASAIDQSNSSYQGLVVGSNPATHQSQVMGISLGLSFHP